MPECNFIQYITKGNHHAYLHYYLVFVGHLSVGLQAYTNNAVQAKA